MLIKNPDDQDRTTVISQTSLLWIMLTCIAEKHWLQVVSQAP